MTNAGIRVCLIAWAFLLAVCGNADGQKITTSSTSGGHQVLYVNFKNNGQHLTANVGQRIEITLGMVGPRQYDEAQVSSPAIRVESKALVGLPNPGGPTFKYTFKAVAAGEAQITVPITHADDPDAPKQLTFKVTIRVKP